MTAAEMHNTPPPLSRPWRRSLAYLFGALALSFIAYGNSLGGDFVFDDVPTLVENDCHRSLRRIPQLFDPRTTNICSLRPVRFTSFALDHALWGQRTFGYHLTNVVLHALVAWLWLGVLLRLRRDRLTALLAAGLFVIHPITTEAVAYVSGRRDLLMALFALLTVRGYLAYVERGGGWRLPLLVLGLLAALLSHESAAVVPAALIVLEVCRRIGARDGGEGRRRWVTTLRIGVTGLLEGRRVRALGVLLLLAAAFACWTILARSHSERHALWGEGLLGHAGTVFRMHVHYLKQLVVPTELIADYSPEAFAVSRSLWEPGALAAFGLLVGLIGSALVLLPRVPLVSAAILGYFVLLLPASQIVVHHELMAEHRLYLAALCFCGLIGAGASWLVRRTRLAWVLVFAIAVTCLGLTISRNTVWGSSLALWSTTVKQVPRCARAQANLGAALATRGKLAAARKHLEIALRIRPDLCMAQLSLGQVLLDTGQLDQGLRHVARAARCKPSPHYLERLGSSALALARYDQAAAAFRRALAIRPTDPGLRYGMGTALHRSGDREGALKHYRSALRSRPRWPKLLYRTSLVLAELCRKNEALQTIARFVSAWRPDSAEERRLRAVLARCE